MLILCCSPNQESAASLVPGSANYRGRPIDQDGQCDEPEAGESAFYYCRIQFAGAIEPKTGKPGLALLPGTVVYNGMEESFLQSFAHFRDHQVLHGYAAVVFQPNSALAMDKDTLIVRGRGHVTVIRATPLNAEGRDFELSQYGPGLIVVLAPEGKPGMRRSSHPGSA